jgi:hypothetical protein
MNNLINLPRLFFVLSLVVLWFSAILGASFGPRLRPLNEEEREDFGVIRGALLGMLGLLIGFIFSMAVSRYEKAERRARVDRPHIA